MEQIQTISIQQKQIFLRNQILQGGLDPQSFMDYMGTVKNQGQNIQLDSWTMQELKQVVTSFKKQIKADTDTFQKVKQSQTRQSQEMISKIIKSVIKKQKVNYDKGVWDYQLVNQHECKTLPKPFNFNPKIKPKVNVTKWDVRSQGGFIFGIGATKQLWLKIQTNFTDKSIQRTNSDLEWFRTTLLKTFPGSFVPPLAQVRSIQPDDKKGLTQRTKIIQEFLNSILQYEYLIQSTLSKIFFTEYDHNRFTNYKNKQRNTYSRNVSRIQTLEGVFDLQISNQNQKFIKNCNLFGKFAQQSYTQIQTQIGKVLSDMQTLGKHILYLSNSCGTLHQKYAKLCKLNSIQNNGMQNIMLYLHNLFSNVGKSIKQQMGLVQQFSRQFIESNIRTWQQFLLHDRRYQKQLQNYLTFKTQLIRKKQRYFNDISKWQLQSQKDIQKISRMNTAVMEREQVFGLMFPKDNKYQEEMRIWVAYLNKIYEKSFNLMLRQEENRLKQKFCQYIEKSANLSHQNRQAVKQFKDMIGAVQ